MQTVTSGDHKVTEGGKVDHSLLNLLRPAEAAAVSSHNWELRGLLCSDGVHSIAILGATSMGGQSLAGPSPQLA